jgi:ribosomal protein L19E
MSGTKLMNDIQNSYKGIRIKIVQNDDIIKLIDKHLYEESKKKGIAGYRIRVFSDSGSRARKDGENTMAGFMQKYDNIKTYFFFDTPFYRLYVGDFRTLSEALKCLKSIESDYPDAFIVRSRINYPSL